MQAWCKYRSKILHQSYFIAVNDIKSKHFSNVLRDFKIYNFRCIRQPVAQELEKIHVLVYMRARFVCLLREYRCLRAKSLLGFDWTCVGVHQSQPLAQLQYWLKKAYCRSCTYNIETLKSTSISVRFRGISRLPSAFVFLQWFKLAHISIQVCTFHDGWKQGIDQQNFNRKSISRKITHPQSWKLSFACNFPDWRCVIFCEIDFLLKFADRFFAYTNRVKYILV